MLAGIIVAWPALAANQAIPIPAGRDLSCRTGKGECLAELSRGGAAVSYERLCKICATVSISRKRRLNHAKHNSGLETGDQQAWIM